MNNDIDILRKSLNEYIGKYNGNISINNAIEAISNFNDNWKEITEYSYDRTNSIESLYGQSIAILEIATYEKTEITEHDIKRIEKLINEYDKNENVKYCFITKQTLFLNLGLCWHRLGPLYDNRAIEALKKYVFYLVAISSQTKFRVTTFSFKRCNNYLYQSLINEQLVVSSPTTFNDPFDCPIYELLKKGDEISDLIRQVYKDCLKIACFTSKEKLPKFDDNSEIVIDTKRNDLPYLDELMWAHYADSHKGICIKYNFPNSLSLLFDEDTPTKISYFKDVKYSSDTLNNYSNKDNITLEDAFFLKSKRWEYENELRYLYFDLNSKNLHETIDIPNCIESIYFGLKCSELDKKTIINIMKNKKSIIKDIHGNNEKEEPIKFYQMEFDENIFGKIKAVEINLEQNLFYNLPKE